MLHHTRIAVYSCWIFVPTMSSPTETRGTVSTERYYSTWVRTLSLREGEDPQWNLTPASLQKDTSLLLQHLKSGWHHHQQLSLWAWGWVGCPSHSWGTILFFFKKSLEGMLPDTSLPPLKGPRTEGSYQKTMEGFLRQGTGLDLKSL